MILNCREATRLISDSMLAPLPWTTRVRMRIHLMLCQHCTRFEEQARWMKVFATRNRDDLERNVQGERLSVEACDRIRQALSKEIESRRLG